VHYIPGGVLHSHAMLFDEVLVLKPGMNSAVIHERCSRKKHVGHFKMKE